MSDEQMKDTATSEIASLLGSPPSTRIALAKDADLQYTMFVAIIVESVSIRRIIVAVSAADGEAETSNR